MRLNRLSLDIFGHFSGKVFDFGDAKPGQADFHVVYGPNEAGKTTTMEAILRLLYGFPLREPYDFLHERKNLSVSGKLDVGGRSHNLTRLPKQKDSLVDENKALVLQSTLDGFLGDLKEAEYRQLLCLNDETIESGGEEILNSKGDIGKLLFSAAAGISDLSGALQVFEDRADDLYRKGASKTQLAILKKELRDIESKIKDQDVLAHEYEALNQTLSAAQNAEDLARAERTKIHGLKAKLENQIWALPVLMKIQTLEDEIAPFAAYPESFGRSRDAFSALWSADMMLRNEQARLAQRVEETEAELRGLNRQPEHLRLHQGLADLEPLRIRFVAAQQDLDRRQEDLGAVETLMVQAARDLKAVPNAPVQELVLSNKDIEKLEQARELSHDVDQALKNQSEQLADARKNLAEAQRSLDLLKPDETKAQGVQDMMARHGVEHLAPAVAAAQQEISSAKDRYEDALAKLAHGDQEFAAPPANLPGHVDIVAVAKEIETLATKQANADLRVIELSDQILTSKARVLALQANHDLVDAATMDAAVQTRDQHWSAHRETLSDETAQAFETMMTRVDGLAQQRLDKADLGAQLQQEEQSLALLEAQQESQRARLEAADAQRAELEGQLKTSAKKVGLGAPISPAYLATWVELANGAKQALGVLERARKTHQTTLDDATKFVAAARDWLGVETHDFHALTTLARGRADQEREHYNQVLAAERARDHLQDQVNQAETRQQTLLADQQRVRDDWTVLVTDLFGQAFELVPTRTSIDQLRTLKELDIKRVSFAHQISGMKNDQDQFSTAVIQLAKSQNLKPAETPMDTFNFLQSLEQKATHIETRHEALSNDLSNMRAELEKANAAQEVHDQELEGIASLFPDHVPTTDLADLQIAVNQAHETREKRQRKSEQVAELLSMLKVDNLDAARSYLNDANSEDLHADLSLVEADLARVEREFETALEARTHAASKLASVSGDDTVAQLVEARTTLEQRIENTVFSYAETKLGLNLAHEAIRRYREQHRSHMIEATQAAFCELTSGRYTQLTTRLDDKTEILLALDRHGASKQAADMSKGTRFQLYLALRAAAYEQMSQQGHSLPFLCDDIFETFDEERTTAACQVMQRIGASGQAIYFTHHRHVVDIATRICGTQVTIHNL